MNMAAGIDVATKIRFDRRQVGQFLPDERQLLLGKLLGFGAVPALVQSQQRGDFFQ